MSRKSMLIFVLLSCCFLSTEAFGDVIDVPNRSWCGNNPWSEFERSRYAITTTRDLPGNMVLDNYPLVFYFFAGNKFQCSREEADKAVRIPEYMGKLAISDAFEHGLMVNTPDTRCGKYIKGRFTGVKGPSQQTLRDEYWFRIKFHPLWHHELHIVMAAPGTVPEDDYVPVARHTIETTCGQLLRKEVESSAFELLNLLPGMAILKTPPPRRSE